MLTNYIRQLTTKETNITAKEQYFRVVCLLLKLLSTNIFKYICFNYLQNVINFIRLVNNKTSIIASIIRSCLI